MCVYAKEKPSFLLPCALEYLFICSTTSIKLITALFGMQNQWFHLTIAHQQNVMTWQYQEELSVFHGADVVTTFLYVNSHESDTRKGGGLENVVQRR